MLVQQIMERKGYIDMKKLEGKVAVITGASKGIGEGIARVYAKYGAKLVLAARGERVVEFANELCAQGKVAVITGASKGIGEGIARVYAKYGAKLVLAARGERVVEFANELCAQGYDAIGVRTDVTDKDSVLNLVKCALDKYGTIDVLVNNAGVCILGDLLSSSDEDRDYHFDINIKGVWNVTRAVAPVMMMKKEGKIVIMSSVTGDMVADPGEAAYATSKAALVGFTKAVARELADYNITVNAICPGYVRTPMAENMAKQSCPATSKAALVGFTKAVARELADYNITVNAICPGYVRTPMAENMAKQSCPENPQSVLDGIAAGVPLKRLAEPEEIGELAAFLGCYESSYITGAQIVIDGGSTLPETSGMGV